MNKNLTKLVLSFFLFFICSLRAASNYTPFLVKVIDVQTGCPVPLVELELENGLKFISDNDGHIAVQKPDLEGLTARFKVKGHGYHTENKDFFGEESISLKIIPGGEALLKLNRSLPAQRLYRITGAGRYNHTLLADKKPSFDCENLLPGGVIGQDSVICVPFRQKLWFFYGDTLGLEKFNFGASCAWLPMPRTGIYNWEKGLPLNYITDTDGFAAPMISTGKPGFTWIEFVLPVNTLHGRTLIAKYVQHETLEKTGEAGFAVFSDYQRNFKIVKRFHDGKPHKCKHPTPVSFDGISGFLLSPFEFTKPEISNVMNTNERLYYSPLAEVKNGESVKDSLKLQHKRWTVNRDKSGVAVYDWKNIPFPINAEVYKALVDKKMLRLSELPFAPVDLASGKRITAFNGSSVFNAAYNCWISIIQGNNPGEIYFSRADTAVGPWSFAIKVSEFSDYNLYNPAIHPWFNKNNDKTVFYEGTYTNYFSASKCKTPEADYNQVMFRLDLDHHDLLMPVPVYYLKNDTQAAKILTAKSIDEQNLWNKVEKIAFYAFETTASDTDLFVPKTKKAENLDFKVMRQRSERLFRAKWQRGEMNKYLRLFCPSADGFNLLTIDEATDNNYGMVFYLPEQPLNIAPYIKPSDWKDLK